MVDSAALELQVVHASPGRLRLRAQREWPEDGALRQAERSLAGLPGVDEVRWNPLARSLVVSYDPHELETPRLLAAMEQGGISIVEESPAPQVGAIAGNTELSRAVTKLFGDADQRLARVTGGAADLRTLVPLGLFALAMREVLAGRVGAAPWYVLAWYAYATFKGLRKSDSGDNQNVE